MLADANNGDVDSFGDSLESDLADEFDMDTMADDDNMGQGPDRHRLFVLAKRNNPILRSRCRLCCGGSV